MWCIFKSVGVNKIVRNRANNRVIRCAPVVGNGLNFDGVNEFGQISHNSLLNCTLNGDFTFEVIAAFKTLTNNKIFFAKRGLSPINGYMCILTTSGIDFYYSVAGQSRAIRIPIANFQANIIHKIVIVKIGATASNWRAYVNGNLVSTTVIVNQSLSGDDNNTQPIYIARDDNNSNRMDMYLFGLKKWDYALTASQVLRNNAGFGLSTAPVLNLNFRQKQGASIPDISGNGFNCTLTNMETTIGVNNDWVDTSFNPITS